MSEKTPQTYANHTRFDPLFHFFLLPVFALGVILSLIHFFYHLRESDMRDNIHSFLLIVLAVALLTLAQSPLLCAQAAGPHHSTGRTPAPDTVAQ